MDLGPGSLSALANLLTTPEDNSDSEDEKPESGYRKMGPGDIGSIAAPENKTQSANKTQSGNENKNADRDIWHREEVASGSEYVNNYDPRPQPEYDIVYRQAVGSEDVFLQMGNKTPATSSCDQMVVKIKLPETQMKEVELDVKNTFLDCRTPKYYLGLHLPHPVDPKSGKAQWDEKHSCLHVTLRMNREYDFMNY